MSQAALLTVEQVHKHYDLGQERLAVLNGLTLHIDPAEMVAIMGPSGSGKTTLLNCLSAIDTPDEGIVTLRDKPIDYSSHEARTLLRRQDIGIIFQFFNLIPTLSVFENIELPFLIQGHSGQPERERVQAMLEKVGLAHRAEHLPHALSGGEMQLASIARALVHQPGLILADEPTGNVNPRVGRHIMDVLRNMAHEEGCGVLMVTHSPEHAAWADRICFLKDGKIAENYVHHGDHEHVTPIYEHLAALDI